MLTRSSSTIYDGVIVGAGGAGLFAVLTHTRCWLRDGGAGSAYRPVRLQPQSNDVASIPPKERVY